MHLGRARRRGRGRFQISEFGVNERQLEGYLRRDALLRDPASHVQGRWEAGNGDAVSKPTLVRIRLSVIPKAQSSLRAGCIVLCRRSRPFRLSNACNAMALTTAHLELRPLSNTDGLCRFRLPVKRLRAGAEYPTSSPVKSIGSPRADGWQYR